MEEDPDVHKEAETCRYRSPEKSAYSNIRAPLTKRILTVVTERVQKLLLELLLNIHVDWIVCTCLHEIIYLKGDSSLTLDWEEGKVQILKL